MNPRVAILAILALVLLGCSDPAPRFGEATLSAASPRATLVGTTWGDSPALELAPGCPGYLDPEVPAHLIRVREPLRVRIQARSDQGPLALAVARGDEVRCESDEGAGHAPALTFTEPGDYQVFVASLRAPAELRYTLEATAGAAIDDAPVQTEDVSVTITSEPSGATVRDEGGRALGTTPAMFAVPVSEGESERSWTLELEGHEAQTVTGELAGGALVLHGQLVSTAPPEDEAEADAEPDEPTTPRRPRPRVSRLPELPNHADIVAVLARLRPTIAQRCGSAEGSVRVYFALAGSGRVTRVSASGTAPTAAQSCVAQAVRRARFPRFRRSGIDVDYTYDLAPRVQRPRPIDPFRQPPPRSF